MARTAQPIHLSDADYRSLTTILRRGTTTARTHTRARVLDHLHRGEHPSTIAHVLSVSVATVFNIKRRYLADGLDAALTDKPRTGRPIALDGVARAKITALACSAAPQGHARWTLRLLADTAVELGFVAQISHNAVNEILKKNDLQPHRKKQWCIGAITSEYLARMKAILHLYTLPYNAQRPIVCLDELPVQLLGDKVTLLPMQPGTPRRQDYEYTRAGTAALLVSMEPLSGTRLVETSRRRTKADYCRFMQQVSALFPHADKIVLIQDNLNTHNASSFYENLPPAEAFALVQRFEFHYTPKKASWLNMAELELSALSRICLVLRLYL